MFSTMGPLFFFIFLGFGYVMGIRGEPLKCYQCNVERNDLCTDEFLTPCPADQASDRCMTQLSYSKQDGYGIKKSCALAPCEFRDPSAVNVLGLNDQCDRSQAEYDCVWCCRGDACNKDSAPTALSASGAVVTVALSTAVSLYYRH